MTAMQANKMLSTECLNKLYDLRSDGICESCDTGFDKCLEAGKPICKEKDYGKTTV